MPITGDLPQYNSGPTAQQPGGGSDVLIGPANTTYRGGGPGFAPSVNPQTFGQNLAQYGRKALQDFNARQQATAQQQMLAGNKAFLDTLYGPQNLLLEDAYKRKEDSIGYLLANDKMQRGFMQSQYDNDLAALGIKRAGIGLDKADNAAELKNIGINRDIAGKLLANALFGFDIDEREARQGADRDTRGLKSDLTARGAFLTGSLGTGLTDIGNVLTNSLERTDLGRSDARLGNKREMAGYDLAETRANNRAAGLDLAMQQTGLDEKNLGLMLDKGLAALGLDTYLTKDQILDAQGGIDQQKAALAASILQQAIAMANSGINMRGYLGGGKGTSDSASVGPRGGGLA